MQRAGLCLDTRPLLPIQNQNPSPALPAERKSARRESEFAKLLEEQQKVVFSRHAAERLDERGIGFTEGELSQLDSAVSKMAEKGARESLIYLRDAALIVSIPNRTVITAMDGTSARENIFTNIDSAAIL